MAEEMKTVAWACAECGSQEIHGTAWVEVNTNRLLSDDPPTDQIWCPKCEKEVKTVEIKEVKTVEDLKEDLRLAHQQIDSLQTELALVGRNLDTFLAEEKERRKKISALRMKVNGALAWATDGRPDLGELERAIDELRLRYDLLYEEEAKRVREQAARKKPVDEEGPESGHPCFQAAPGRVAAIGSIDKNGVMRTPVCMEKKGHEGPHRSGDLRWEDQPAKGACDRDMVDSPSYVICPECSYTADMHSGWSAARMEFRRNGLKSVAEQSAVPAHVEDWTPLSQPPSSNRIVMVKGTSGLAPEDKRTFVAKGYFDPEYRPKAPWRNLENEAFSDYGYEPLWWRELRDDER